MENGRGNGIFLGIVSLATLIVAIIGATFAYFSASTESSPNAVGLSAYEFKLSLSVTPVYPTGAAQLIPLNPQGKVQFVNSDGSITDYDSANNTNLLFALNEAKTKCVDDSGLQVCALYMVTINNQAGNTVTLRGELTTTSNTASTEEGRTTFQNLKYQALTGSHTDNTLALSGEPKDIDPDVDGVIQIADVTVNGATFKPDGSVDKEGVGITYVLVYLNDSGNDQSSEMGASYTGKLTYVSKDGIGNALTGTFQVAAPDAEDPDAGDSEQGTDEPGSEENSGQGTE